MAVRTGKIDARKRRRRLPRDRIKHHLARGWMVVQV